jgi:hypothetical protein
LPNHASDLLSIATSKENEGLEIIIKDLTGREILRSTVKTKEHVVRMPLVLINGAYIITVTKSDNENVTEKLLIAK